VAKNALILPIAGCPWKHPPDTAPRIGDISPIPGNQMHVDMGDGLSGGRAIVNADVESVRRELFVENALLLPDDFEQRVLFFGRQIKKRSNVSIRDRQRVTWRDGIPVSDGKCQRIGCDDATAFHGTKGAFKRHALFYINIASGHAYWAS
jgi:hypothetical protein